MVASAGKQRTERRCFPGPTVVGWQLNQYTSTGISCRSIAAAMRRGGALSAIRIRCQLALVEPGSTQARNHEPIAHPIR
jgi:hypothetical protein